VSIIKCIIRIYFTSNKGELNMESIKKALSEFLDEMEEVCGRLNISYSIKKLENNPKEIHIILNHSVLLRIYDTKKGVKPDISQANDISLVNRILEVWKQLYNKPCKNQTYTYTNVNDNGLIETILKSICNYNCTFTTNNTHGNGVLNSYIVQNSETHEKITVTYYSTKKLTVQGLDGLLWELICQKIETTLNLEVKDIYNRISLNSETLIHNNDFNKYEVSLKNLLTKETFDFLSLEDQQYLISSHKLIVDETKLTLYSPILCSASLALDGYLKKLLVEMNILISSQVIGDNFNYGLAFNGSNLTNKSYLQIDELKYNRDIVKNQLEFVYGKFKTFRNPFSHSNAGFGANPLLIKSFEKCKLLYENEFINTMKTSYNAIYR